MSEFQTKNDSSEEINVTDLLEIFRNTAKWVPGTPENLQNPDLYELNHVIPLSIMVRFYELCSATWRKTDLKKLEISSAYLRTKAATIKKIQIIEFTSEMNTPDFQDNLDELKDRFSKQSNFSMDLKKYLLFGTWKFFLWFQKPRKDSLF